MQRGRRLPPERRVLRRSQAVSCRHASRSALSMPPEPQAFLPLSKLRYAIRPGQRLSFLLPPPICVALGTQWRTHSFLRALLTRAPAHEAHLRERFEIIGLRVRAHECVRCEG